MKRLIVLTILVTTVTATSGCRRGMRLWGLRGARCGAPAAPSFTPVPTGGLPASCPVPSASIPCDVCPPASYGGVIDGGYGGVVNGGVIGGGVIDGGVVPGSVVEGGVIGGGVIGGGIVPSPSPTMGSGAIPSFEQLPAPNGSSFNVLPSQLNGSGIPVTGNVNNPAFSQVIGDRKLQPGETLKGEYELPVESASTSKTEKK